MLRRQLHLRILPGCPLPSMLPMKLISLHAFKRGNVALTRAFPFSSSAPLFTMATLGFLTPTTFLHIDGTHLCKLYQMIRSSVYVGSAVDQKGNAFGCRDQRGKRRSLDTFDPAYDHLAAYQNSSVLPEDTKASASCFLQDLNLLQ